HDRQGAATHADRDAMRAAHQRTRLVDLAATRRVERGAAIGLVSGERGPVGRVGSIGLTAGKRAPLIRWPAGDMGADRRGFHCSDRQSHMTAVRAASTALHVCTVAYDNSREEAIHLASQFLESSHRSMDSTWLESS